MMTQLQKEFTVLVRLISQATLPSSNPHSRICTCVTTLEVLNHALFRQVEANLQALHPQICLGKK